MMDDPFPKGMVTEIGNLLANDSSRPPGKDVYPEVFECNLMFPLQRKRELARMMQIARSAEPKVVFEIGADKGGGLYHWCKCLNTVKRVIACEIRGTPYNKEFEQAFPELDFLWLPCSSYDQTTITTVEEWLAEDKIDCLFIDGDKCAFLLDFESYKPFMSHDGVVFMHDINDSTPYEAFKAVEDYGSFSCERIIDITESTEELEKQAKGFAAVNAYENWLRYWHGRSAGVGVIYLGGKPCAQY